MSADVAPPGARVLLVDASPLLRGALAAALAAQPDFAVVGEAATASEAVDCAVGAVPDVIVLDVEVAEVGALAVGLRDAAPSARVVVLSADATEERLISAVRAGVHGYLLKDLPPAELFDALRRVQDGEYPVTPSLVGPLFGAIAAMQPASTPPCCDVLSAREREILRLAASGHSNRAIGQRLFITEGTVKNHVHNALRKLNVSSRAEAARAIGVSAGD